MSSSRFLLAKNGTMSCNTRGIYRGRVIFATRRPRGMNTNVPLCSGPLASDTSILSTIQFERIRSLFLA